MNRRVKRTPWIALFLSLTMAACEATVADDRQIPPSGPVDQSVAAYDGGAFTAPIIPVAANDRGELSDGYALLLTLGFMVAIGVYVYVETRLKRRFGWPRICIAGDSHQIPRVCPNCLAVADIPLRYAHRGLFAMIIAPWMGSYQTFYYCAKCARSAKAWLLRRAILQFFTYALTGLFTSYVLFGLLAGFAASAASRMLRNILPDSAATTIAVALGIILFLLQFRLLWWGLTRWFMNRSPLERDQAVWGVAAFYTSGWDNYIAARPEWIRELARQNYMYLRKADYIRLFGEPTAPATMAPERPFHG